MRILLDESLPQELQDELPGHSVLTVRGSGWSGLKNGELLRHAADLFDVFVTADQNLQFQQNLSKLPIAVLVLVAPSNRMEALEGYSDVLKGFRGIPVCDHNSDVPRT